MAKINHSRPYLKYIDNLKREFTKLSEEKVPKTSHPVTLLDKMVKIKLSEFEKEKLFELFDLGVKYVQLTGELYSIFLDKSASPKRAKLNKQREKTYQKLETIRDMLVASEFYAQSKGRQKGVFDWWKLLEQKLKTDGVAEFLEVADEIFTNAVSKLEIKIKEVRRSKKHVMSR